MNILPLRLPPGVDLRKALEAAALPEGADGAFVISGIGSLMNPRLRFADAAVETALSGPFEIVSLAGSITANGAHLHMVISNGQGAVLGGHVTYGNEVRTTAEVLLAALPGWQLGRELDPATGFNELVVRTSARLAIK